jgi:hypothetical protein
MKPLPTYHLLVNSTGSKLFSKLPIIRQQATQAKRRRLHPAAERRPLGTAGVQSGRKENAGTYFL